MSAKIHAVIFSRAEYKIFNKQGQVCVRVPPNALFSWIMGAKINAGTRDPVKSSAHILLKKQYVDIINCLHRLDI